MLLLLPLLLSACAAKLSTDDATMISRATEIAAAIVRVQRAGAEYPANLDEARAGLAPGTSWPVNPYNEEPILDTGKPDFEGEASVGNVCYNKVMKEDEITNFSLTVFGRTGILKQLGLESVDLGNKKSGGPAGRDTLDAEPADPEETD
jgi:hypothetical protein